MSIETNRGYNSLRQSETTDAPREVSLTFDDGPDPIWTPRLLETLARYGVQATFFVVTPLAQRYPQLISKMLRHGHSVEFHCVSHVRHSDLTVSEIAAEAEIGLGHLESLGIRPEVWRTPWGITSSATMEVARRYGLGISHWTHDTHDWRGDSASTMLANIGPSLAPGAVVLMHDGIGPGARRTGCGETISLVKPLVERIRALGCRPAPMSSLSPSGSRSHV